jgi:hypothetical protein
VRRWLYFSLALVAALAALVALSRGGAVFGGGSAEPRDHIDPASRARLEQVLRDAEKAPAAAPKPRDGRS